jgi:hypothetical protein
VKIIVFLGPTMPVHEARMILDAVYLRPAKQGDLLSCVTSMEPDVIALIDGYFYQEQSVWHKEIIFALSKGVAVYGSSSMGALRAAETREFGMIGRGAVYESFATGQLNDDDEVALSHSDEEHGYRAASEPMVNVRASISAAVQRGIISGTVGEHVLRLFKARHFTERSLDSVLVEASQSGLLTPGAIEAIRQFWREGYVDIKKLDAVELLRELASLSTKPRVEAACEFKSSYLFENLYNRDRTVSSAGGSVPLYLMAEKVAIDHPNFAELNETALLRALVLNLGEMLKIEPSLEEVEEERRAFLFRLGLTEESCPAWLTANHLSSEEFGRLIRSLAVCRRLQRWYLTERFLDRNVRPLLDELKIRGEYSKWFNHSVLERDIINANWPSFERDAFDSISNKQLVDEHAGRTGWRPDRPVSTWAADSGFRTMDDLRIALLRSKLAAEHLLEICNVLRSDEKPNEAGNG